MYNTANVGVAVLLKNDKGHILSGLRKSKLGNNSWGAPGGKLERGESIEECIIRESKEEIGVDISDIKFNCITNDIYENGDHFITIFVDASIINGTPKLMEPNKCVEWKYIDLNNPPDNLFLPMKNLIEGKKYN